MNYKGLLDILLLPKNFFRKLKDNKTTLYLGIVILGFIDVIYFIIDNHKKIFDKPALTMYYNITLMIVVILLFGLIDVLFFSLPLYDLFKRFKKESDVPARGDELPKLMKIYILASLLIFPANLMVYFAGKANGADLYDSSTVYILSLLISVWGSAVITRGINVIYNFQPAFKRLVFICVYVWSLLLSYALLYITDNWIIKLLN